MAPLAPSRNWRGMESIRGFPPPGSSYPPPRFSEKAYVFDLPTEAMWEVAARAMEAGDSSHANWNWFFGTSSSSLSTYAVYCSSSASSCTTAVGSRAPNPWGLYDVYGSVPEICRDWGNSTGNLRPIVPDMIGSVTPASDLRVVRGGLDSSGSSQYSSLARNTAPCLSSSTPYRGVRLALVPSHAHLVSAYAHTYDLDNDGIVDVVCAPEHGVGCAYVYQYFSNGRKTDIAVEATDRNDYQINADGSIVVTASTNSWNVGAPSARAVLAAATNGWNAVRMTGAPVSSRLWVRGPATVYTNGTHTLGAGGSRLMAKTVSGITNGVVRVEQDSDGDGVIDVIIAANSSSCSLNSQS